MRVIGKLICCLVCCVLILVCWFAVTWIGENSDGCIYSKICQLVIFCIAAIITFVARIVTKE